LDTGPYANPAQAALALRRALAADPGNIVVRLGLMELFRQQGRLDEARALGEAALGQGGDLPRLMGLIYAELGAVEPLLEMISAHDGAGLAALDAGARALNVGRLDAALALFRWGLERRPEDWGGWLNLCKALIHAHRLEEAQERAAQMMEMPLGDEELKAQFGFLRAVALLLQGRLPEGLPWLECRFGMRGGARVDPLPLEPWRGEDVAGRTLVIQAEQGFGDVFMLARYARVLAARGAKVLLRPQKGTQGVLATCDGLSGLAEGQVELPANALQVPIMSLPALCGTTLETIPRQVPYLGVPSVVPNREAIDACLGQAGSLRRIGLVWAGNPVHNQDRERSLSPELLEVFAGVPGVAWVDLQVMKGPRPALPMLDLARHLSDFSDTAYAMERLDGLISVDSSPVHLAGALGRPVWLALAWLPDWRWMLERRDSPWYPTVELWRQPSPGDWVSVLMGMRERLIAAGTSAGPFPVRGS